MTKAELDAIKARCDAATTGPWCGPRVTDDWPPGFLGVYAAYETGEAVPMAVVAQCGRLGEEAAKEDAEFIAHSRTDIPRLVAEVERLQGKLQQLSEMASEVPRVVNLIHRSRKLT